MLVVIVSVGVCVGSLCEFESSCTFREVLVMQNICSFDLHPSSRYLEDSA